MDFNNDKIIQIEQNNQNENKTNLEEKSEKNKKDEHKENSGNLADLHEQNQKYRVPQELKRDHTNTIISLKERKIIENIKKSNKEGQKSAIKKLIVVSIICSFFMAAEVVGGLISGSLAILSDAAHMLSDFSGFAISMISIVISRNKPTYKLSYGYHRAEILGALCSILLIWGLTIWLVYEAIMKIYNKERVDDPLIMLIVAIIGLICNIAMGHVLHSAGGHHGHSHSHGHEDHHDEHHGHDNKQEKPKHSHGDKKKKKDKKKVEPIINANAINNISGVTETTLTDPLIEHSTSDNNNAGRDSHIQEKDHQHEHGDSHHASHDHDHENCDHKHEHEKCGHDHEHENCDYKHEHDKKEIHEHSEEKKHKPSHKSHGKKDLSHKKHKHDNKTHEHDHNHEHHHDDKHDHNHEHHHDDKHDHHHQHEEDDHGHDHHGHDNLNIRAAFIHVIGDLIQSVGVVLAAVFIMIWPQYDIIDPICTFVFSIIVVCTTIPILCDCIRVFMEGTPAGINPDKILEDLHKVSGVEEIHDLHVWVLSMNNNALSCHIKSPTPMKTLKRASRMINTKYKILHTTIQIEHSNYEDDNFDCETHHTH